MILTKTAQFFTIPTLWRYFLSQYSRVFFLSLFAFLTIMLSTRLEDFARFVSLGASLPTVLLYVIYQIPYVLQIALPISSLISSLYLFQKLSQNNALTAMRAAGISLFEIVAPLLLSSTVIALITFQLVLDLSADAHLKAKELEFHLRSMNPLALMHNSKMLEQGGISVEMNGSLQRDGKTKDFIMAIHRQEKDRMALFIAKEMYIKGNELKGKNLSLISTFTNPVENRYDHLVIENAKENVIPLEDLASAMTIKRLRTGNDELRLPLLIAKKNDLLAQLNKEKPSQSGAKRTRNLLNRCYTEIARRLSLSLAIITFALLGAAFGSTISRTTSRWRFIPVIALTCFFLICFLGAKAVEVRLLPSLILYFLPHIVLIIASVIRFMRIERGVEE